MKQNDDIKWFERDIDRRARGHHAMGLGWVKRDRLLNALESFHRAIDIDPSYIDPYLEIGRIYLQLSRWNDLLSHCHAWLQRFSPVSQIHKMRITACEALHSLDAAYELYDLRRVDQHDSMLVADDILCCVTVRNEVPRLPFFLDYYRALGVNRFLVVDNSSTDGSREYLLAQPDVLLWQSSLAFDKANFGSSWFELMLRRYGIGHWCLIVDTDEFLVYRGSPAKTLRQLCRAMERQNLQAMTGQLLDMYSAGPVSEAHYRSGQDPLEVCPFFDRESYTRRYEMGGQYHNQRVLFGGVRQRLFPAVNDYLLSKVVLLQYQSDVVLDGGQHLTNIPAARLLQNQMVLLHFKFFSSMPDYACREAQREEHAMGAQQYKAYQQQFAVNAALTLYDPVHSIRYEGVAQLEALGIIDPPVALPTPTIFPPIAPCTEQATERPFWSVMVTVYERSHNLRRVLESVLAQASDLMQIEVVSDGGDPARQRAMQSLVAEIGGGKVQFHASSDHLGHPHIFNLAIARACGQWVHILHDDDWVEPGFYTALEREIALAPQAGAAFTQHRIVEYSTTPATQWMSWLEANQPGILQDWLQRISGECRVQFSAMTVKRSAYEALGGFCEQAHSALDWEMWKRISAHYPVIFIPETLVGIGRDASAETSRLIRSGEQVLHALAAVDISECYLPTARAQQLSQQAREALARYATNLARRYLEKGDSEAAMANLRSAARCSASPRSQRLVRQVLLGMDHEFHG
jgi:tetratricopeptide (TPR) repeat protein